MSDSSSDDDWMSRVESDVLEDDQTSRSKHVQAIEYVANKREWRRDHKALWGSGSLHSSSFMVKSQTPTKPYDPIAVFIYSPM